MLAQRLDEGSVLKYSSYIKGACSGAVLLLAMVFMLLLATLAATGMATSIMEIRMAANDQFKEQAFQTAQAFAAAISRDTENFHVSGGVGFTICKNQMSSPNCDASKFVTLGSSLDHVSSGVPVDYLVERMGPLLVPGMPFRQSQNSVSSVLAYDAAIFEARVIVDGADVNLARAEVAQGIAVLVSNSSITSAQ